jgi:hypothetical protein
VTGECALFEAMVTNTLLVVTLQLLAASDALTQAQAAYGQARFAECVARLEPQLGLLGEAERVPGYVLLARCYDAQRDLPKTKNALRRALTLDPLTELNRQLDREDLLRVFDELKKSLKGRIAVTVTPRRPSDVVLVDGEILPFPATQLGVSIGKHQVTLVDADGTTLSSAEAIVGDGLVAAVLLTVPENAPPPAEPLPKVTKSQGDTPTLETERVAEASARSPFGLGLRGDMRFDALGLARQGTFFSTAIGAQVSWQRVRFIAGALFGLKVAGQFRAGWSFEISERFALLPTADVTVWFSQPVLVDGGASLEGVFRLPLNVDLHLGLGLRQLFAPQPNLASFSVLMNIALTWNLL